MHFKRKVIVFSSSSSRFLLNLSLDSNDDVDNNDNNWHIYKHPQGRNWKSEKQKKKKKNFAVLGLRTRYIHRIYSVGCLWGWLKLKVT